VSTKRPGLPKDLLNVKRSLIQETIRLSPQENSLLPELNHEGTTPLQRDCWTCDTKSMQARGDSLRWTRRSDHLVKLGLCSGKMSQVTSCDLRL